MGCCQDTTRNTAAKLVFKRKELLYDVENYSFVEGDIMPSEDEHSRHQVFDVGQNGNVDRVTRVLNLAHAECVEMLFPYTKRLLPHEYESLNDVLDAPEEYVIELLLPDGFSSTTLNLLRHLIHEYLVCRVLADWMSITNPRSQGKWEEKLQNIKDRVQTSLMSRYGKVRRKLKPF